MSDHKYGCLMAVIPANLSRQLNNWIHRNIDPDHLAPEGYSDELHVTVKHGFVDGSPEQAESLVELLSDSGAFPIIIEGISFFKGNEDGDVLKLDISSETLHKLNSLVSRSFKCRDKYPDYKPHLTLAYLDPKFSKQYESLKCPCAGLDVTIGELVYSAPDKTRTRISLMSNVGDRGSKSDKVEQVLEAEEARINASKPYYDTNMDRLSRGRRLDRAYDAWDEYRGINKTDASSGDVGSKSDKVSRDLEESFGEIHDAPNPHAVGRQRAQYEHDRDRKLEDIEIAQMGLERAGDELRYFYGHRDSKAARGRRMTRREVGLGGEQLDRPSPTDLMQVEQQAPRDSRGRVNPNSIAGLVAHIGEEVDTDYELGRLPDEYPVGSPERAESGRRMARRGRNANMASSMIRGTYDPEEDRNANSSVDEPIHHTRPHRLLDMPLDVQKQRREGKSAPQYQSPPAPKDMKDRMDATNAARQKVRDEADAQRRQQYERFSNYTDQIDELLSDEKSADQPLQPNPNRMSMDEQHNWVYDHFGDKLDEYDDSDPETRKEAIEAHQLVGEHRAEQDYLNNRDQKYLIRPSPFIGRKRLVPPCIKSNSRHDINAMLSHIRDTGDHDALLPLSDAFEEQGHQDKAEAARKLHKRGYLQGAEFTHRSTRGNSLTTDKDTPENRRQSAYSYLSGNPIEPGHLTSGWYQERPHTAGIHSETINNANYTHHTTSFGDSPGDASTFMVPHKRDSGEHYYHHAEGFNRHMDEQEERQKQQGKNIGKYQQNQKALKKPHEMTQDELESEHANLASKFEREFELDEAAGGSHPRERIQSGDRQGEYSRYPSNPRTLGSMHHQSPYRGRLHEDYAHHEDFRHDAWRQDTDRHAELSNELAIREQRNQQNNKRLALSHIKSHDEDMTENLDRPRSPRPHKGKHPDILEDMAVQGPAHNIEDYYDSLSELYEQQREQRRFRQEKSIRSGSTGSKAARGRRMTRGEAGMRGRLDQPVTERDIQRESSAPRDSGGRVDVNSPIGNLVSARHDEPRRDSDIQSYLTDYHGTLDRIEERDTRADQIRRMMQGTYDPEEDPRLQEPEQKSLYRNRVKALRRLYGSKTLSSTNVNLGGALVAPPAQGRIAKLKRNSKSAKLDELTSVEDQIGRHIARRLGERQDDAQQYVNENEVTPEQVQDIEAARGHFNRRDHSLGRDVGYRAYRDIYPGDIAEKPSTPDEREDYERNRARAITQQVTSRSDKEKEEQKFPDDLALQYVNMAISKKPGAKSMGDPTRDREHLLNALGQGDHTAIHGLHDWHQDNPGHEQEQDVADLRDYVNTDHDNLTHTLRGPEKHKEGTSEERRSQRTRSAHAHLTGRSPSEGDLVTVHIDSPYEPSGRSHARTSIHRGEYTDPFGSDNTYVRINEPSFHNNTESGWLRDTVGHHATHHLNQLKEKRKQEGQKALGRRGKKSMGDDHRIADQLISGLAEGDHGVLGPLSDHFEETGDHRHGLLKNHLIPYINTDPKKEGINIDNTSHAFNHTKKDRMLSAARVLKNEPVQVGDMIKDKRGNVSKVYRISDTHGYVHSNSHPTEQHAPASIYFSSDGLRHHAEPEEQTNEKKIKALKRKKDKVEAVLDAEKAKVQAEADAAWAENTAQGRTALNPDTSMYPGMTDRDIRNDKIDDARRQYRSGGRKSIVFPRVAPSPFARQKATGPEEWGNEIRDVHHYNIPEELIDEPRTRERQGRRFLEKGKTEGAYRSKQGHSGHQQYLDNESLADSPVSVNYQLPAEVEYRMEHRRGTKATGPEQFRRSLNRMDQVEFMERHDDGEFHIVEPPDDEPPNEVIDFDNHSWTVEKGKHRGLYPNNP